MADEVKPIESIVDLCAKSIKMQCSSDLKFLKKSLASPEIISISIDKIKFSNTRDISSGVIVPKELQVRLVAAKGQEKRSIQMKIAKLKKAQEREINRIKGCWKAAENLQRALMDGAALSCVRGDEGITIHNVALKTSKV